MVTVLRSEAQIEASMPTDVVVQHSTDYVCLRFSNPRRLLSSAVYNGGLRQSGGILNYRVEKESKGALDDPAVTLSQVCAELDAPEVTVGMMTAASMDSLRMVEVPVDDERLHVLVTSGLQNARRAGDTAELQSLARYPSGKAGDNAHPGKIGTINLIILCSGQLADEAMVEMVMIATEAKAATLQSMNVLSPVSGEIATGTGTDAVAIVSGSQGPPIRFAGKHTLLGECLARSVAQALRSSVEFEGSELQ